MASIRKRRWAHNGVEREAWVVTYTDQAGKRRLKTFEKKKEADEYRQTVEDETRRGVHVADSATLTVNAAIEVFLKDCRSRHRLGNMAGNTVMNYEFALRHVGERFGASRLTNITSDDVEAFVNGLVEDGYSPNSARTCYIALHTLLTFSVRKRWLKRNILRDEPPRSLPSKRRRTAIPTKADIRLLLKDADTWQHYETLNAMVSRGLMLALALFGGMRPGEIYGLQWEDIDREAGVIRIKHSYSRVDSLKGPKSQAGYRTIPMSPPITYGLERMERFLAVQQAAYRTPDRANGSDRSSQRAARLRRAWFNPNSPSKMDHLSGYVIKGKYGKPLRADAYAWTWKAMMKRVGLVDPETGKNKFTMHALRHAAASLMIEAGMPALHLKTFIGHASISTTYDIYGHLFKEDETTQRTVLAVASGFAPSQAALPNPQPRQDCDIEHITI